MKKALVFCFLWAFSVSIAQERIIKGKISDGKNPIDNVTVRNLNQEIAVSSKQDGSYEIEARTGDKIEFSYTGLKTVSIRIEDVTRVLNPVLYPDIQELEEVTVQASKRRSQKDLAEDYQTNKRIIKTAWGYMDADRAPGRVRMIDKDEIYAVRLCILDLMRNQFAGIRVTGNCGEGGNVFSGRAGSIISGQPFIYDLDGLIITDAPIWLDISLIRRIAIFEGLAITSRYGQIGSGGVVVINTITNSLPSSEIVDKAKLRNNFLSGTVLTRAEVLKNEPAYLQELHLAKTASQAKEIFNSYRIKYNNSPYFILDSYNFFANNKKDISFANEIFEDNKSVFDDNAVHLKALAYQFEEQGEHQMALELYKEIFILRPQYAQSYIDLAEAYRSSGEVSQAASILNRYNYLIKEGFLESDESSSLNTIMNREYNNLLKLEGKEIVSLKNANKLYTDEENYEGTTRLVFEWNDSEAEFDLQFVNPSNQYHTFKHSLIDNEDLIMAEKDFGYNTMEEFLDNSLSGLWKVNVTYHGNKSLTPTYLKATIYYEYGTKNQRQISKVFKLNLKNVNQELFSLNVGAGIVSR